MRMQKISALSRPLDMNYPDNRLILFLFAVVFVASISVRVFSGDSLIPGLIWSARAALSVFFAWAITKEIDPDNPGSAVIASFLGISVLFFFKGSGLLIAVFLLAILRMVGRTTGVPLTVLDSVLIMLMGTYLVYDGKWAYGILMGIAFFMDATLVEPVRRHLLFGGTAILIGICGLYMNFTLVGFTSEYRYFALLVLVPFLIVRIIFAGTPRSFTDVSGEHLSGERIVGASFLAFFAGTLALLAGPSEIIATLPLWVAIGGTVLFDIAERIKAI